MMKSNQPSKVYSSYENLKRALNTGDHAIKWTAYLYGIYALFLLLECIDFLSLLHTAEPGYHATYTIVHVAFFMLELIVYASLTLGLFVLLNSRYKKPGTVVFTVLLITFLRMIMIYYLYWQTEPKVHFIPYIYKKSNDFSGIVRALLLPAQLISGIVCSWIWITIQRKVKPYRIGS